MFGVPHFLGDPQKQNAPEKIRRVNHHERQKQAQKIFELFLPTVGEFFPNKFGQQNREEKEVADHHVDRRIDQVRNAEAEHHALAERSLGASHDQSHSEVAEEKQLVDQSEHVHYLLETRLLDLFLVSSIPLELFGLLS